MSESAPPRSTITAPAKLTLSLRVTGTRPDGLHTIDAEMVTVDLADRLDVIDRTDCEDRRPSTLTLADTPQAAGLTTGEDNLVLRALARAGRRADVTLTKRIPTEAGLGGGSADAAAILRWAGLTDPISASELGADVAFCLVGGRARVTGIGELVESLPHVPLTVTIMSPPVRCPTGKVFQAWDRLGGPRGPGDNDLELAALAVAPELGRWRQDLADQTGQTPQLAGSGSSWFVRGAHPGEGRQVAHTVPGGLRVG